MNIRTANKTYKRKIPILWWTKRASYLQFVLRELTSLAVAYTALLLFFLCIAISRGESYYAEFITRLRHPVVISLSIIALTGLIFHTVTWFSLAPKALVLKVKKQRLPDLVIILTNYIGLMIISLIIGWFLFTDKA